MKTLKLVTAALLVMCCVGVSAGKAHAATLRAGTAKIDITPSNPRYPVHDRLYARSLILEVDGVRVGFISYDNTNYSNERLLEQLKEKYNLQELFFSQSHTHSGGWDTQERVAEQFTQVLDEAAGSMFDAQISGGWRSFPQLQFNRVIMRDNGRARESWEGDDHYRAVNPERIPFGPVDNAVGVIRIDDAKGNPRAIMMNYACHPDVAWNNFEISADYVGYATKWTEEAFDGRINCLFVQGAAGNQAPLWKDGGRQSPEDPRPSNYDLIERMGKLLGIEAVKLTKELYPNPYDAASLKVRTDSIKIAPRWMPSGNNQNQGRQGRGARRASVPHFSTIVINDRFSIATFPGEPFIKFQLDWKREMAVAGKIPFFFGYTWNGGTSPGYVADIRSSAYGGYGTDRDNEIGTGEEIMNRHLENYYWLEGAFLPNPAPAPHPF